MKTLADAFEHTLQDVYYAENAIVKALPKVIDAVTNADLKSALKDHLGETKGQIKTFRPHRASNRLDGSRSESGKPARHIGAIAFILGSEAFAEPRLLNGNYPNVKKEPEQHAVAEEMPVGE